MGIAWRRSRQWQSASCVPGTSCSCPQTHQSSGTRGVSRINRHGTTLTAPKTRSRPGQCNACVFVISAMPRNQGNELEQFGVLLKPSTSAR
eukprot:2171172-Rhodomonas_salina.1